MSGKIYINTRCKNKINKSWQMMDALFLSPLKTITHLRDESLVLFYSSIIGVFSECSKV